MGNANIMAPILEAPFELQNKFYKLIWSYRSKDVSMNIWTMILAFLEVGLVNNLIINR